MTRMRWVGVGAILVVAIIVGVVFGFLAGVAVVLGVVTLLLFTSPLLARGLFDYNPFRVQGEERFGSDADKRSKE